jgi:hypothetical protein
MDIFALRGGLVGSGSIRRSSFVILAVPITHPFRKEREKGWGTPCSFLVG